MPYLQVATACTFMRNFRKYLRPQSRNTCYSCYMAVNLRSVTGELHQKLKMRAAQEGVTIESLCVRFLWWGLDVADGRVAQKVEVYPSLVPGGEGNGEVERLSLRKRVGGSNPSPSTNFHDPKACRIYRCGMCAAIRAD